jgi:hypothetical protein
MVSPKKEICQSIYKKICIINLLQYLMEKNLIALLIFCCANTMANNSNEIYIVSAMSDQDQYQRLNNQTSTLFSSTYNNGYRNYYQEYSNIAYSKQDGNKINFYSTNGTLLGWSTMEGNKKSFYSSSGVFLGWANKESNKTDFYLADGTFNGWSSYSNSQMIFYDKNGTYIGYIST